MNQKYVHIPGVLITTRRKCTCVTVSIISVCLLLIAAVLARVTLPNVDQYCRVSSYAPGWDSLGNTPVIGYEVAMFMHKEQSLREICTMAITNECSAIHMVMGPPFIAEGRLLQDYASFSDAAADLGMLKIGDVTPCCYRPTFSLFGQTVMPATVVKDECSDLSRLLPYAIVACLGCYLFVPLILIVTRTVTYLRRNSTHHKEAPLVESPPSSEYTISTTDMPTSV